MSPMSCLRPFLRIILNCAGHVWTIPTGQALQGLLPAWMSPLYWPCTAKA